MANENQTEFVFEAKDDVTPVVNGLITALGRLNTTLPVSDKQLTKFEASLAGAATKAGLLGTSLSGSVSGMTNAQRALAAYSKTVADFEARGARTNAAGRTVGANGQFISARDVAEYQAALRGISSIEDQIQSKRASRANTHNAEQLAAIRNSREVANATNAVGNATEQAATKASKFGAIMANVPPNSTRYALYDVSSSLLVLGAALTAGSIAAVGFAASYERAFADVERTVNDLDTEQLVQLNKDLMDLASTIPVTFQELSHIASLGGQLGIAGSGIDEFTESVAKISTVSDLTADKAATAFGRFKAILGVPEQEFDNLASSILAVGVNSVATESQIVNITTQIASMAGFAGFTADQVIGLSGALASIGAPPELSRGVVTRLFATMSESVAEGGLTLERFSQIAGVSSKQFEKAWGTPEFANVFVDFMQGIAKEGGNAVATLHELGITSVRDVPLLMRLASAADSNGKSWGLLTQTMKDAKVGWQENTELTQQYEKIAGTFVERLKVLGNNFANLAAVIGGPLLAALSPLLNATIDVVKAFTDFAATPVGGTITTIIALVTALGGALLLMGSAVARGLAGIIAMQTATSGLMGSFTATKVALSEMGVAMMGANSAGGKLRAGFKGIGSAALAAIGPIGAFAATIGIVLAALPAIQDGLAKAFDIPQGASAIREAEGALARLAKTQSLMKENSFVRNSSIVSELSIAPLERADKALKEMIDSGRAAEAAQQWQGLQKAAAGAGIGAGKFNDIMGESSKAFRDLAPNAKNAREAVIEIGEAADPSIERLQKLQETITNGALAFINTGSLIQQNQQAQQAGAEATAAAQNEAAGDSAASWQQFYDGYSVNLDTYLAQLQTQVDAQNKWKENLATLGAKGVSQEILADLAKLGPEGAPLVQALVDGTADQLETYKQLWGKAGKDSAEAYAISMVATQIVLENAFKSLGQDSQAAFLTALHQGMPLEQALKQWNLDAAGNPIKIQANANPAFDTTNRYLQWARQQEATMHLRAQITAYGNPAVIAALNGQGFSTTGPANTRINVGMYADGGYTGTGGKYQPAGVVHRGEFVFPQEAVNRIGLPNLYAMMKGGRGAIGAPRQGYAAGGYVAGSSMDAGSISQLARAVAAALSMAPIILRTDDRTIASSTSNGATELARRGSN